MEAALDISKGTLPKQARSRARREALIEYGLELLNERDLDELSITDITGGLGFATGSFYSYFRNKEHYFVAVQRRVNESLEDSYRLAFSDAKLTGKSPAERLKICVDFTVSYFRSCTGLVRSALRYERRIPEGWEANRARTQQIIAAATAGLNEREKERLQTALQLAFGLLVNTLLHDPGPLRLSDRKLTQHVVAALIPYLEQSEK